VTEVRERHARLRATLITGDMDEIGERRRSLPREIVFLKEPVHVSEIGVRCDYSARNVTEGSTRAARDAGSQHAIAAIPSNNAMTPTYVTSSSALTPKSIVVSARLVRTAPPAPSNTPTMASVIPWRMMSP
jgi:hypothetical protein